MCCSHPAGGPSELWGQSGCNVVLPLVPSHQVFLTRDAPSATVMNTSTT